MAGIQDKRKRFSTYRKQKDRLKKMAYELAAICGVDVAVISISPSGRADAWPEDPDEVFRIFGRCADLLEPDNETRAEPSEGDPSTSSSSSSAAAAPSPLQQLLGMNAAMLEYVDKRIRLLKARQARAERSKNSAAPEVNRGLAAAGRCLTAQQPMSSNELFNGNKIPAGFGRSRNCCGLEVTGSSVQRPEGAPSMVPRVGNLNGGNIDVNLMQSRFCDHNTCCFCVMP